MKRVPSFDGVRGIAILLVLAGHTVANYGALSPWAHRWLGAFANASFGVRLFFVLSGYLITSLLLEELARTGKISLAAFYRRRAARILPAFYVFLAGMVVLQIWFSLGLTPTSLLAAAAHTWNYARLWVTMPAAGTWTFGHLWTLALEQQFYLFWPGLLVWLGPRRAGWCALSLIVWCPLARVATYFLVPSQRGYIGMMFHTAIDSLMVGCLAALLLQNEKVRAGLLRHGPVVALVGAVWALGISPFVGEAVRGFPVVAGFTLDALAAAWIIAWLHHRGPPAAEGLLGKGLLPWLGAVSYSLYLWQQLFLGPSGGLAHGHVALPWLGAIAAAWISYRFVEMPVLRWSARRRTT
ncbi:MAG: acyltransferase [Opitutaceae bacterium]|jgi:peptidoglycan/LPS O-acetylase OafA/YrhL